MNNKETTDTQTIESITLPPLTKFTVVRSEWLTPDRKLRSCLFNSGFRCCLGFALSTLGGGY